MKYKIRQSQFCSLSREKEWQDWLKTIAVDLYEGLVLHLGKGLGCGANKQKMIEIHGELVNRGFSDVLLRFLLDNYGFVVEEVKTRDDFLVNSDQSVLLRKRPVFPVVFGYYNPSLQSFPHKAIFSNVDVDKLRSDVLKFCVDKVGIDFIIVKNYAFVEYFLSKYEKESFLCKKENREIYKYRSINNLNQDVRVVKTI